MPPTKSGIYHNLKESPYTVSNSEIVFFFSSEIYLNKFLCSYGPNRIKFLSKIDKATCNNVLNMDVLADINLYKQIEKRGFRAWLKGVDINWLELHRYVLRTMIEKSSQDWQRIQKPRLGQRLKSME
jgi:hypothetical protein